ncbi:NepR family anti-sigma factor [Parerythrobacter aurantius]|uniref:NepR family anti-sigma factor n=1 Tax=Parerythrobacter aurantius TaxID=3127706 RepID=UPI0032452242
MTIQPPKPDGSVAGTKAAKPEWANGLRQLYDSVVDEPLPDSFKDLLSKLDVPAPSASAANETPKGGDNAR